MARLTAVDIVLDFWFAETLAAQRFAADPVFDARIAARFGTLHRLLAGGVPEAWRATPDGNLAGVLVLDQFSRNIHRGTAAAFANDAAARALAESAVARGDDAGFDTLHRQFLDMPLMHAEDAAVQARSVALFGAMGNAEVTEFAQSHATAIDRFGRFPARNAALGRASNVAELAFLAEHPAGF